MNAISAAAANFLYHEARLMDDNQYQAWFDLFEKDCTYWVPQNTDDYDPNTHVSIIYAQYDDLAAMVERLATGRAWSQVPPSRMVRTVSNVEVANEADGELTVHAVFNLTELRKGKQRTLAGRSTYRLVPRGDVFGIAFKKVHLLTNDTVIDDLTFLV